MSATTRARGAKPIRPFTVEFSDAELKDLHAQEPVADHTQGVPLATMQELAHYWVSGYDWRACEARLNAWPQFLIEIDGLDIHVIHVRSQHEDALPLLITHGWPGSVIEQLKIVDPLTNPTAHGASAADAFHLVIPSLPGHGFSAKPTTTGWDPGHIARAWVELMGRLGYERFAAQGGDWGAVITDLIGAQAPPELIGIHSTMPGAVPPEISKALTSSVFGTGYPRPTALTPEESRAYEQLSFLYTKGIGYAIEMALRPQTLYGIADSPVGLAAWMLDHDAKSLDLIANAFAGGSVGLTRDDVLDNCTLYWLTNTGVSAARLYCENTLGFFDVKGVGVPAAVTVFPDELYQAPRSWAEQAYPNLVYYNKVDKGGHFAAWEQPRLFAEEVRAGLRPLR
jgi:pimeloyl-ACP methyl ester carboxylesterase